MRPRTLGVVLAAVTAIVVGIAGCGGGGSDVAGHEPPARTPSPSRTVDSLAPCGAATAAPRHYESVVVFSFENRRWSDVGLGFGPEMPYLHTLALHCSWFPSWQETDPTQNSLTQYIGQVTGAREPGTENDCSPSRMCSTDADNLFRQLRESGRSAVNYVEGANRPCSADGNAVRHVPALYLWDPVDRAHCGDQVRPLNDLKLRSLPAFAFVTPTLCNGGHNCGNRTVNRWAREHIQPVLDSGAYRAGKVAVFVWYDEDTPVPNLWIAPTAVAGPVSVAGAGAAATLKAWQSMLGVPCLENACRAVSLRAPARA